mgnify:CR=1 FL=1
MHATCMRFIGILCAQNSAEVVRFKKKPLSEVPEEGRQTLKRLRVSTDVLCSQ